YTPTYGDLVETYSYSGEKSYIIEYDDMPLGIKDVKTKQRTNYLRYNRPFTKDKAVTIMLPFDFRKNDIRDSDDDPLTGHFYEFAGIEEVPINMWIAVMREVGEEGSNETTETTMKANTPYLFMPCEDTKYLYFTNGDDYYQGFDIFTEGYDGGTKEKPYDGSSTYSWNKWNFKGTYQPRYWSDSENSEEIGKVYGFAGATKEVDEQLVVAGDFVRVKSGAKIRPTSCYLEWVEPKTNESPLRRTTRSASNVELPQRITVKLIGSDGTLTNVGQIDTVTGEISFEGWYTLQGVKLDGEPIEPGIYINNGKKVSIK
ncbi:MAG: hypothetical protein J6T18_06665, partial [Bacteroidaceae bacterium]|nr:hypothetical protein [Bacteroidaceae bacterium]